MSKVFTAKKFIERLEWLTTIPNVYHSGKGWSERNSKGQVQFDCVVSVKCILWNFRNDYKINKRGGTIYCSNGVPDFTCNGALNYCSDVSTRFDNLVPGEYLCMKGTKYNHTGIYLGNGKVFEDTSCRAWGVHKAVISDIDKNGTRSLKGKKCLKWTYHGKLKWIDYKDEPIPMGQVAILQSKLNEQWNCGLDVDNKFGPKTSAACSKHNLYKGIKAEIMVGWLQQRLIDLGYSVGKCGVDKHFGNDTKKAVGLFQKNNHLAVDYIVGKNTYKALTEK